VDIRRFHQVHPTRCRGLEQQGHRLAYNGFLPHVNASGVAICLERSCSRTCCAPRTAPTSPPTHPALAGWDPTAEPDTEIQFTPARVIMQDFTGVPVHRRPRRDARGDGRPRRRPGKINPLARPSWSSTTRSSPTSSAPPTRSSATSSSSTSATASATSSCAGARRPSTTSRSCRRAPASCTRSTSSTSPASCSDEATTAAGLPRHARRHRLAHDDGQRPRRARLGRRRHRGRGRHARPAGLDAHPAGRRLQAHRRAARGRDRDRPRAHDHRDAAPARRRRQVRRVLRRGRRGRAAGQPRHDRQHEPEYGSTCAIFPIDDETLDYLRLTGRRRAGRARRGLRQGAGLWHDPAPEPALLRVPRARPVDRRAVLAGPKRPQDRVELARRRRPSARAGDSLEATAPRRGDPDPCSPTAADEALGRVLPGQRPGRRVRRRGDRRRRPPTHPPPGARARPPP
jgi:aconitate hydratase